MSNKLAYLLLFTACMLTYFNVVHGEFLYDDLILIKNNPFVKSLENIPYFFSLNPTNVGGIVESNFYRPNQYVINSILYHFFGENVVPYHLFSILLHFLNGVLLYKLFQYFKVSILISLLLSMLFIVHPINLEAISYVSGVADPLALLFMLTGVHMFLKERKFYIRLIKVTLCFCLALLSKESAVVFPFLLLGLLVVDFGKRQTIRQGIRLLSVNMGVLTLYLYLKFTIFSFTGTIGLSKYQSSSIFDRILTFIGTIPEYVQILLYPKDFYIERPYVIYSSLFETKILLGLALITGIIFLLFQSKKKKNALTTYGIIWLCVAFIPFTGLISLNAIYLEHWFYVPFIGVLLLLSSYLNNIKGNKEITIIFGVLIIGLMIRSHYRNKEWSHPELFYKNELSYAPESTRMLVNLGNVYLRKNEYDNAKLHYQKALSIRSNNLNALYNLALVHVRTSNFEEAEKLLLRVVRLNKNMNHPYIELYKLYSKTNNPKKEQVGTIIHQIASYGIGSITAKDINFLFE